MEEEYSIYEDTDDNSTFTDTNNVTLGYTITYILLLIVEIPAILCTSLIIIFFLKKWQSVMNKVLHNHAIFLLIVISFLYTTFDLPFIISYYRLGYDVHRSPSFCAYWYWLDYTLLDSSLFLTATASIQRHILVFHGRWLQGPRKRWIFHYIPLGFSIFYPLIFYLGIIAFYPCPASDEHYCPFPCYFEDYVLSTTDWVLNVIFPVCVIVVANMALICRVIYSMDKIRHPQSRIWRKRRKLVLQLLAFSMLYVLGWGPSTFVSIVQTLSPVDLYWYTPNLYYINNSNYFVCPLQPFICLFALPELLKFIQSKFRRRGRFVNMTASVLGNTHF